MQRLHFQIAYTRTEEREISFPLYWIDSDDLGFATHTRVTHTFEPLPTISANPHHLENLKRNNPEGWLVCDVLTFEVCGFRFARRRVACRDFGAIKWIERVEATSDQETFDRAVAQASGLLL